MAEKLNFQDAALWGSPVIAFSLGLLAMQYDLPTEAAITAGITILCVLWWVFEPLPIPVTSLLPLCLLPMLGVLDVKTVSQAYGDKLVLLLLGGFILSTAMEKSGAHLRLAMNMVRLFGGNSSRMLVFGFMAASAFLSMWISNTATTLMLLPVAMAVIEKSKDPKLAGPLLLGVAYAASVGGIGTPIGTPPNIVFSGAYAQLTGEEISFVEWMSWGVPVVLLLLPTIAFWLTRNLDYEGSVDLPEVGAWSIHERRVLYVFVFTALGWITRSGPLGGWTEWLNLPASNEAMVAMLAVVLMFVIPDGKGSRLLDWDTANRIPWGMLILFGAGISIAAAFMQSGLSDILGEQLAALSTLHVILMIGAICCLVTFLTEMTSNTATTTLLMPILGAAAVGAGADPVLFMVPAAMSASCAFMLPVATPPNVVVFSTGRFKTQMMVREGVVLNFLGAIVITVFCYLRLT